MYVYFDWTTKKAIEILTNPYHKKYLKTLNDFELFELGKKEGMWSGENPFTDDKQRTLI